MKNIKQINKNGQVVVPKENRAHLKVEAGDYLKFVDNPDGTTTIVPVDLVNTERNVRNENESK